MADEASTKYKETSKGSYLKTSGFKDDVKQIVKDVGRFLAPRVVRERSEDIDDAVRRREGQSTDSNNKY